jgi:hypothetical protein
VVISAAVGFSHKQFFGKRLTHAGHQRTIAASSKVALLLL